MVMFRGHVLLPAPAWTTYSPQVSSHYPTGQCTHTLSQAKLAGHQAIPVPTSETYGWKLTPSDLRQVVDNVSDSLPLLLVLTNPGNPSGAVYTRGELEQLAGVCREHSILVLSDEIYARLVYSPGQLTISYWSGQCTHIIAQVSMSTWSVSTLRAPSSPPASPSGPVPGDGDWGTPTFLQHCHH